VVIGEDGDNGFLEAAFKGTHTGPLNAPSGAVPATGKAVEIPFIVMAKVEGGKYNSFHLLFRYSWAHDSVRAVMRWD
jgi:hypothetical protein